MKRTHKILKKEINKDTQELKVYNNLNYKKGDIKKMIKLYEAISGRKFRLISEGETLHEAIEKAYEAGALDPWDELYREDFDEQIEALVDYVSAAHQDYVIEDENIEEI